MKKLYKLSLCVMALLVSINTMAQKLPERFKLGETKTFLKEFDISDSSLKTESSKKKLKISETESFDIKVNYSKQVDVNNQTVMGEVGGSKPGNFFIIVKEGKVEGNIILPKSKKAYRYSSNDAGVAFVEEVDINGVVCIDMEHGPEKSAPSKEVAAEIGVAMLNLQSLPGANGCILLDFDGYNMPAGNLWNGGNSINAAPSGMSDDAILEHWEVVSEDFRPFNLNITTSEAVFNSYPRNRRMRCVVTPTNTAAPGAGGVAYIGSFSWDNDVPCWVFITSGKSGGEASSHEIGHTFGLGHDGRTTPSEGYFAGHGDWSPIMGVGYYKNITQWSKGEYAYANNLEDDLVKMSGSQYGVGYRTDDFGNAMSSAANLVIGSNGSVSSAQNKGIIERTTDVDFFTFQTSGGNVSINVRTVERHGDLDILVRLYNESGAQIGTYNPTGLHVSIATSLSAGKYYFSVDGTGAGNPATDGYSEYASLGSYFISGTIPPPVTISENAVAIVYKNCTFGGYAIGLEEGDYTLSQLQAKGISDNDISSLKVNFGFKVILFDNSSFGGNSVTINSDDDCLVDNGFNDVASSIRIRPDGATNLAGTYYLQNRNSNLTMDIANALTANGTNILQWNNLGGQHQQFEFVHLGDGVYRINIKHSGKAIDISSLSKADGANVHQWEYVGGNNQKFILKDAGSGYYKLIAKHSSKIVGVDGASTQAGANVAQQTNHNGNHGHWKMVPVVVNPPSFTTTIQAENYSVMAGVQTEATTDAGGGLNVGYIDLGDWMAYNSINFPTTGAYLVEYRVASVGGGRLSLDLNAGAIQLGALNVPNTGGWQNWTTISHTVNVNAGTYNVGIFAQAGGWNINWIRITRVANAPINAVVAAADTYTEEEDLSYLGSSGTSTLELYPNPVENPLSILSDEFYGEKVRILSVTGDEVYAGIFNGQKIDLSNIPAGIYSVLFSKNGRQITKRIIKK